MNQALEYYDAAKTALQKAVKVDDVKKIRDKAEALRAYAKQQDENLELQNYCAEIRLRAERRAGQILIEMKQAKERRSGHGNQKAESHDVIPKLADLGISLNQSSQWQKIANIPDDEFEKHVAETKAGKKELTTTATLKLAPSGKPSAPNEFNRTNENVDWAWWTWNPVTGCLHGCDYCYARDIANRFYDEKFKPTFHADRLEAPKNTKLPTGDDLPRTASLVFTCSMADLFGKWVPDKWVRAVFDQVATNPQWTFLFLTKFPQRLCEFTWPDNAWCGTTVDTQARVINAEKALAQVKAKTKWLSCEPMMERLTFNHIEMFNWIVMGGCSPSTQTKEFQPPWEWILHLSRQADKHKIPVYFKPNLKCRKEYPEG